MKLVSPELAAQADAKLAAAFRKFALDELRYDWCCRISERSRQLLRRELERRGVTYEQFSKLGRGRRKGGPFAFPRIPA